MAVLFSVATAFLLLLSYAAWSLTAALFSLVAALGATYAWLAAFNRRDWARDLRDHKCPNCGCEYAVTIWSSNP